MARWIFVLRLLTLQVYNFRVYNKYVEFLTSGNEKIIARDGPESPDLLSGLFQGHLYIVTLYIPMPRPLRTTEGSQVLYPGMK